MQPFRTLEHTADVGFEVKAITYHQFALEETPQGWRAQVYVDI
jgi:SHS2 domain-containing protein